jgi:hypothetical protein
MVVTKLGELRMLRSSPIKILEVTKETMESVSVTVNWQFRQYKSALNCICGLFCRLCQVFVLRLRLSLQLKKKL